MGGILHELYGGEIQPGEKFRPVLGEFQTKSTLAYDRYEIFRKTLPEQYRAELNTLVEAHTALLPLEMEQNFIEGFCLGVRLISEVYAAEV